MAMGHFPFGEFHITNDCIIIFLTWMIVHKDGKGGGVEMGRGTGQGQTISPALKWGGGWGNIHPPCPPHTINK